ncbi:DUF1499 domain-containing protein [Sphingorhabdus arenilitoris]|uniref:DUF1499 domain-containing protein n=1 Tax=Sphingorhabdus arenilitoris TaxID=1490041 RepID=A0ABV8RFY9_9SPHN
MTGDNIDPAAANAPLADNEVARGFTAQRDWQTYLILALAVGAALWGLIGPVGSGIGLWGFGFAITGMFWSFWVCVVAVLLGGLFVFLRKRAGKARRPLLWLGIAIALFYAGWLANMAGKAEPRIHDISTDLADPPAFQALPLRADNLDNVPGAEDEDMRGLNPQQRWTKIHQEAYSDIRTVRIAQPVGEVMAKAQRLAKARGWEIASFQPEQGRMEATETSTLFRFKDDIVLRVRPTDDGKESIIDMRSVSRVGQSDLGVNAKRVRSFLADLAGTVTTAE